MDDDDLGIVIMPTVPGVQIVPFFAYDPTTGKPCFGVRLTPPEKWPWGADGPLFLALDRRAMATFLGDVVDVAERVYSAVHGEDDDGSGR